MIVLDYFGGPLLPSTRFAEDLGADSLDRVALMMKIEDEFGINLKDEPVHDFATLEDLVQKMEKYIQ